MLIVIAVLKKREFRKLWISRINAAARQNDISYSRLMHGLKLAEVGLDRKVLADLAVNDKLHLPRFAVSANLGKCNFIIHCQVR